MSTSIATGGQRLFDDEQRLALDAAIEELSGGELRWTTLTLHDRARLLKGVHATVAANAQDWAETASAIKGLDASSELTGEEWTSGPYAVLSSLLTLAHALDELDAGRSPLAGVRFGTAPGDRITVSVLPHSAHDALLFHGFRAEVWMPPAVSKEQVQASAGLGARTPTLTGGVGLVLGAGNITSIPPLDVLYELIANNRVSVLKLNPVMAEMESVYRRALAPLIEADLLRIVQGGAEPGGYLAHHPRIAHVHITGSAATHDVIVYGAGAAGRERKVADTPLLDKPITSELGGVGPIIVLPGVWTRKDLRYQAEHVVTMRLHNGGYNCIAGQIIVLSSDWPQKDAFLAEVREVFENAPHRPAWYPGSVGRVDAVAAEYPRAERFGVGGGRLLVNITAEDDASMIQTVESFSPVLGVIEIAGVGQEFLNAAVRTVNRDLLGTLGANIIAQPRDSKALGAGFREAIAGLEYGTIAINAWTGVGFSSAAPWGAFPGHPLNDVQSGRGVVHNALLISEPERTVVTGPFRPFPRSFAHGEFALFPKPPWFVTSRSAASTGRKLAGFRAKPSWLRMPGVFAAAFRA